MTMTIRKLEMGAVFMREVVIGRVVPYDGPDNGQCESCCFYEVNCTGVLCGNNSCAAVDPAELTDTERTQIVTEVLTR